MGPVKNKKRKDHQGRAMLRQMREYKREQMNLWDEYDEELLMVEMDAGGFQTFLTSLLLLTVTVTLSELL